jgi:hypothetical protein
MALDLFGKEVQATYDSLIKIGDNNTLTAGAKRLSDGRGNDAPIWLSTEKMGIGITPDLAYTLTVAGDLKATNIDVTTALTATTVQLTGGTGTQGTFLWNNDENTVGLIQNGTTLQLGQQTEVHVKNQTGSTIAEGTPVYVTGTLGVSGRLTVAPMIADGSIEAKFFIGITNEDIPNGFDGKVITFGKIRGLDTSAYTEGQTLFVSDTVAGEFTTTAPISPSLDLECAIVVSVSATNGTIFVRANTGLYLPMLHDVYINGVADGESLIYNATLGRWENGQGGSGLTLQDVTDNGNTTTNNIGIGTTPNASTMLHVKDDDGAEIRIEDNTSTTFEVLRFIGDASAGEKGLIAYNSANAFDANSLRLFNNVGDVVLASSTGGGTAVERVRVVGATGNVGINSSSPTAKLMVLGSGAVPFRWGDSSALGTLTYFGSDPIIQSTGSNLLFYTGVTERMRIWGSNVGIATTTPLYPLDVVGTIRVQHEGTNLFATIRGPLNRDLRIDIDANGDSDSFIIRDLRTNAERFIVQAGGNVGIGTTPNASAQLHIKDNDGAEIRLEDNTSTAFGILRFVGDAGTYEKGITAYNSANGFDADALHLFNPAGDIVFRSSTGGGTGTERMRIDAVNGRIGIGTSNPTAQVHIAGDRNEILRLQTTDATLGSLYVMFADSAGDEKGFLGYGSSTADNFSIWNRENDAINFGTNNTNRVEIDSFGNLYVGIKSLSHNNLAGKIIAGDASAVGGGTGFQIRYADGNVLNNFGSQRSSAYTLIGYGAESSKTVNNQFTSTADVASFERGVLLVGSQLKYYNGAAQNTAVGSPLTMTERFTIGKEGNVGINEDNPDAYFIGSQIKTLVLRGTSTTDGGGISLRSSDNSLYAAMFAGNGSLVLGTISAGDIQFRVGNSTIGGFSTDGYLGIRTTTPQAPLHVVAAGSTNNALIQEWSYTSASLDTYSLMLKQTVTSGVVRYNFSMVNNSVAYNDTLVLDRGNIGVGTAFPEAKLHLVGGDMYLDGVSGSAFSHSIIFRTNSTAEDVGIRSVGEGFEVYEPEDSNKVWFRILDDPQTNTAAALLNSPTGLTPIITDYNKGDYITQAFIDSLGFLRDSGNFSGTLTGDNAARIVLTNSTEATLSSTGHALQIGITAGANLIFDTNEIQARNNGSAANLILNQEGGRVGIGIATPSAQLDILTTGEALRITGTGSGNAYVGYMTFVDSGGTRRGYIGSGSSAEDSIIFNIDTGYARFRVGGSNVMYLTQSANVGIGIANPIDKLEVNGIIKVDNASGELRIGPLNAGFCHFYTDRPKYYFNAGLVIDDGTVFSYNEDLLLGRANTTSDYIAVRSTTIDFYLDGNLDMRLENDGDLQVDGDVVGYSTTTSDARFKDNVVTIDSALDKIKRLRGVEYDWNATSRKGQRDLGFIAQELEKVLPELVREKSLAIGEFENSKVKAKTVDYEKITAVLVEAMKEQQEQIEDLKAQVERLIATR